MSACCPMALHMRILAFGSSLQISRTASMPPMSGMTISIVTRSGCSCLYFSTACTPVSASPTISKPACVRMSPTIVRMKIASSQIKTVWLTRGLLRVQNLRNQNIEIENHDRGIVHGCYAACDGAPRAASGAVCVDRQRTHVEHFVDDDSDHAVAVAVADEQNRAVGCGSARAIE